MAVTIIFVLLVTALFFVSYFIILRNIDSTILKRQKNQQLFIQHQLKNEMNLFSVRYTEWLSSTEGKSLMEKVTLQNMDHYQFSTMMVFDHENEIQAIRFYDLDLKETEDVPVTVHTEILGKGGVVENYRKYGNHTGLVVLDQVALMVHIEDYVFDPEDISKNGVIIVGRYLNTALLSRLTSGPDIFLEIKSAFSDLPEEYKTAYTVLMDKEQYVDTSVKGRFVNFFLYPDINDKDSLVFRAESPNFLSSEKYNSMIQLLISFSLVGFLFILISHFVFNQLLFTRIHQLLQSIIGIRHGNVARRMTISGQDEFTNVVFEVNRILDSFEYEVKKAKNLGDARYQTLFEQMRDIYYKLDSKGYIRDINPAGVSFFGYSDKKEMLRMSLPLTHYVIPMDRDIQVEALKETKDVVTYEMEIRKKNGVQIFVEVKGRGLFDGQGRFNGEEANLRDISDRKQREKRIQLLASVFDNSLEGVVITNTDGVIVEVNKSFNSISGYGQSEALGRDLGIIINPKPDNITLGEILGSLQYKGFWSGEVWSVKKSGEDYSIWLSVTVVKSAENNITHYIAVFHDITARKLGEMKLKYQAYHDSLTQLPNRKLFLDRLEVACVHARRHGHMVGILFLDMDNFKQVNDTLGHHVGDLYLQEITNRLKKCCRDEDTIARMGGDEFTVLLPDINEDSGAIEAANRIIDSLSQRLVLKDVEFYPSASIGITMFPNDGDDIDTLVKNADMAMYYAKEHSKGSFALFSSQMNKDILKRVSMERNMRNAIDKEEFSIYYQPIIDLEKGEVSELEALIRWRQDTGEVLSPDQFISLAEHSDLIFPLGEWVLKTTCEQGKRWHDMGYTNLGVAVNLTAKQFQDPNLVNIVNSILDETGFSAEHLILEITEETLVKDIDSTILSMDALKSIGIQISLDDFGTGYSSLSYLDRFPLDNLKIDKSFIFGLPEREESVALVQTILTLGKSLGLSTIAEGVEKPDQLEFLRESHCDHIQGYFFSKPLPVEEMTNFLVFSELSKQQSSIFAP